MADKDRDTVYTNNDVNRSVYSSESSGTGWFVGIIIALALIAIAYIVFSANSQPSTTAPTAPTTSSQPASAASSAPASSAAPSAAASSASAA